MKEIIVNVSPAGKVSIDVNGFTGTSCTDATAQIEIALGGEAKRKDKPERFMPPQISSKNSNKLTF